MVFAVGVVGISKTSGHLEWASTMTRNEVPLKGPAKSRCSRCHGFTGQVQGCTCKGAGACVLGMRCKFWRCFQCPCPPYIAAGQTLHSGTPRMISIQFLQDVELMFTVAQKYTKRVFEIRVPQSPCQLRLNRHSQKWNLRVLFTVRLVRWLIGVCGHRTALCGDWPACVVTDRRVRSPNRPVRSLIGMCGHQTALCGHRSACAVTEQPWHDWKRACVRIHPHGLRLDRIVRKILAKLGGGESSDSGMYSHNSSVCPRLTAIGRWSLCKY